MSVEQERCDAFQIEKDAKAAEERLISALRMSDIFSMCYAYKSRVKPNQKLLEKKIRKIESKPQYELHDITDVIGIRFVTLFRSEMPNVFRKVINMILHVDGLSPNPFIKDGIDEVIIYKTNQYDDVELQIKSYFDSMAIKCKFESILTKEGYSSIHIVARLNHEIGQLSCTNSKIFVPVEIQIRTVFEDAWGEIDHKYGYAVRAKKDQGSSICVSGSTLKHLKILKRYTDACAEYADAIHVDVEAVPSSTIDVTTIIPNVSETGQIDLLKSMGIETVKLELYQAARDLRSEAQKDKSAKLESYVSKYLLAAEKFKEIADLYPSTDPPGEPDYYFYYYLKMNEAICLMSTNIKDNVQYALSIYQKLYAHYTDFPLLIMRLAQCHGKLGNTDNAIELYVMASSLVNEFEERGATSCIKLLNDDYEHMKKYLPRLHGYQLWKKFKTSPSISNEEKISLLISAYNVTMKAVCNNSRDILITHNNLLYYGIDLIGITKACNLPVPIEINLRSHLDHVLESCDSETSSTDIGLLDTLSKAYDAIEDWAKAASTNNIIMKLALGSSAQNEFDKETVLELAREAYNLNQKYLSEGKLSVDDLARYGL